MTIAEFREQLRGEYMDFLVEDHQERKRVAEIHVESFSDEEILKMMDEEGQ